MVSLVTKTKEIKKKPPRQRCVFSSKDLETSVPQRALTPKPSTGWDPFRREWFHQTIELWTDI